EAGTPAASDRRTPRACREVAAAAARLALLLCLCGPPAHAAPPPGAGHGGQPAARVPHFESDILPLFTARCLRCPGQKAPRASGPAVAQHDVIPILLRRCTVCHGRQVQEGGLDLRTRASMLRGGKSGPALVPGRPGESLLIKKVRSGAMPPLARIVEVSIKPI